MTPTRVILGTMPPLLGDIIRETLGRHADVEVAADVLTRTEIVAAVSDTRAHVAILGVAPNDWPAVSPLLGELFATNPRLTIIAIASDGRSGYVYQLQPRTVAIDDVSPTALVEAIRANTSMDVHPALHPFSAD